MYCDGKCQFTDEICYVQNENDIYTTEIGCPDCIPVINNSLNPNQEYYYLVSIQSCTASIDTTNQTQDEIDNINLNNHYEFLNLSNSTCHYNDFYLKYYT